ncbi:MAG: hypothetical protein HYX53_07710 [Chloroflexi bacterium]|nr:hypothetical protein [Chloroflexota bacterium]
MTNPDHAGAAAISAGARAGLAARVFRRCRDDGEFRLAARYWTGGVRLHLPGAPVEVALADGVPTAASDGPAGLLAFTAPAETWEKLLAPIPPPAFNDIAPAAAAGLAVSGDMETYWQYYPAIRRLVDLVREEWNSHGAL